jgi:hypothetical protein
MRPPHIDTRINTDNNNPSSTPSPSSPTSTLKQQQQQQTSPASPSSTLTAKSKQQQRQQQQQPDDLRSNEAGETTVYENPSTILQHVALYFGMRDASTHSFSLEFASGVSSIYSPLLLRIINLHLQYSPLSITSPSIINYITN